MTAGGRQFDVQIDPQQGRVLSIGLLACLLSSAAATVQAQPPSLDAVFPAGGLTGQSVEIAVHGGQLERLSALRCSEPGIRSEPAGAGVFRLTIPGRTPPGHYDVWGIGPTGITAARSFIVGNQPEQAEVEPNDAGDTATRQPLNTVMNGQIAGPDPDWFRFEARRGERVVIECWAERIDSTLRAVLEVTDAAGQRLAVNRGYFGIDPAVVLDVPADGEYLVRVQDLVGSGSPLNVYRLAIGTGPRVVFAVPNVVQRGTTSRVALYGWNLPDGQADDTDGAGFDRLDVEIVANEIEENGSLPALFRSTQSALADRTLEYWLPGSSAPVLLGVTDVPVAVDDGRNHAIAEAQEIAVGSEVSGQLVEGDERDWYAIRAQHGEVLYLEAFGERIGSPVDLQLEVTNDSGTTLAGFADETTNLGGVFATNHLDPGGRWVCPVEGRYLISIRNLRGGLSSDARRTYRLSVRREEPTFHVVAVPQGEGPNGVNVPRGGRIALDLLAIRERGMTGAIRVFARDLPPGVEVPDVWLGPGITRGLLVISADDSAAVEFAALHLEAAAEGPDSGGLHHVRTGTVVRAGTPGGRGRLTSPLPLAVAGASAVRIVARGDEPLDHHLYGQLAVRHSPGSILDVQVEVNRRDSTHVAPVRLIGIGVPDGIENQASIIPPGEHQGYVSFRLPPHLPLGTYSLAIVAETTAAGADGKIESVQVVSNPVVFRVEPAAFRIEIDPFSVTRARRGETFQLAYSAKRLNGFIGKLHTELATPGRVTDVNGLRGRGETFVGQTDRGSLQITVNDDAPLGPQQFLRLLTVGVVEDEPTYFGSCFVPLEIVE